MKKHVRKYKKRKLIQKFTMTLAVTSLLSSSLLPSNSAIADTLSSDSEVTTVETTSTELKNSFSTVDSGKESYDNSNESNSSQSASSTSVTSTTTTGDTTSDSADTSGEVSSITSETTSSQENIKITSIQLTSDRTASFSGESVPLYEFSVELSYSDNSTVTDPLDTSKYKLTTGNPSDQVTDEDITFNGVGARTLKIERENHESSMDYQIKAPNRTTAISDEDEVAYIELISTNSSFYSGELVPFSKFSVRVVYYDETTKIRPLNSSEYKIKTDSSSDRITSKGITFNGSGPRELEIKWQGFEDYIFLDVINKDGLKITVKGKTTIKVGETSTLHAYDQNEKPVLITWVGSGDGIITREASDGYSLNIRGLKKGKTTINAGNEVVTITVTDGKLISKPITKLDTSKLEAEFDTSIALIYDEWFYTEESWRIFDLQLQQSTIDLTNALIQNMLSDIYGFNDEDLELYISPMTQAEVDASQLALYNARLGLIKITSEDGNEFVSISNKKYIKKQSTDSLPQTSDSDFFIASLIGLDLIIICGLLYLLKKRKEID